MLGAAGRYRTGEHRETGKTMNSYYLTSQLVSDRQTALTADCRQRAQVKQARAARKASAATAVRPARIRRLLFGRPAPATA